MMIRPSCFDGTLTTERRKHDPNGYGIEDYLKLAKRKEMDLLDVPIFLTERGTPLSPKTFRQHY
jgi:hypothetical protein